MTDTQLNDILNGEDVLKRIELASNEMKKTLYDLRTTKRSISKESALKLLNMCYEIYDRSVEIPYSFSHCKTGCNACCYEPVYTHFVEIENIKAFVSSNFSRKQANSFSSKFQIITNSFGIQREESKEYRCEYFNSFFDCPFLVNGRCAVYKVRPLTCRGLVVFPRSDGISQSYACLDINMERREYKPPMVYDLVTAYIMLLNYKSFGVPMTEITQLMPYHYLS